MFKPLISVIIPIYKVEKYLCECLDSVVNQTYSHLEIILVDDGSPDSCPQICGAYAEKDNRVKVVHKINGGLSDARNAGLDIATGEYISFVDSDDIVSEKFIEMLLMPLLQNDDASVSVCAFNPFYDDKYESSVVAHSARRIMLDTLLSQNSSLNTYLSMECNSACNKLYRRSLFDDVRYPKGKIYEDVATTYKILYKAVKIYYTQSQLYFYRVRSDSIMGKKNFSLSYLNLVDALHETIVWFETNKLKQYVKYYYPALLMPEMYAWWGLKNVIKDKGRAQEMLEQYRQDVDRAIPTCNFSKSQLFVFKILGMIPFLYELYRRFLPGKFGGR